MKTAILLGFFILLKLIYPGTSFGFKFDLHHLFVYAASFIAFLGSYFSPIRHVMEYRSSADDWKFKYSLLFIAVVFISSVSLEIISDFYIWRYFETNFRDVAIVSFFALLPYYFTLVSRVMNELDPFVETGPVIDEEEIKSRAYLSSNIYINEKERTRHTLVLGANGSGKTYSAIYPLVERDIKAGGPVLVIDPKGDNEFLSSMALWCENSQRELRHFSLNIPETSSDYNPMQGSATSIKDGIISATDWSEPYYKKVAEVELLKTINMLKEKHGDEIDLIDLIDNLPEKKELMGLKADLELMLYSDFGGRLLPNTEEDNYIDFIDWWRKSQVIYIGLDVLTYPESGKRIGRMVLANLKYLCGQIQRNVDACDRYFSSIFIDEFGSVASNEFIDFLNKARSSKMGILMATQSLGDLEIENKKFLCQVIDNTSIKIIFKLNDPNSAEYIANMIGTKMGEKETYQTENDGDFSGNGSFREVEEYIYHPNFIKTLPTGHGIILRGDSSNQARNINFDGPLEMASTRFHGFERKMLDIDEIREFRNQKCKEEKLSSNNDKEVKSEMDKAF